MPRFAISPDGARIAFETHGADLPALVLIHGWSCDRTCWNAQLPSLSATAQVVTLDVAGHGQSGCSRAHWTMPAFGADVAAVVREVGAADVILVGHSMGADAALEAARLLPGRVRGLIWIDQYSQLPESASADAVAKRVTPFRSDFAAATREFVRSLFACESDPDLIERVSSKMAAAPREVALPCIEATWNHARQVPALLSELRLPVVTINAPHPKPDIESLNRHGVQVLLMPGGGHFPMWEMPNDFTALLQKAIALLPHPQASK